MDKKPSNVGQQPTYTNRGIAQDGIEKRGIQKTTTESARKPPPPPPTKKQ